MSIATLTAPATATELSRTRLHLLRAGYLLMGVGLALVKWPLLPDARALPLYEGVTLCLLTAMSLLAFLGLRYPVKLLPMLLFESRGSCCGSPWSPSPRPPAAWTGRWPTRRSAARWSWSSSPSRRGSTCGAPTSERPVTAGCDRTGIWRSRGIPV
jgi:hypothetical protein